jgi:hypothetical protein
MRSPDSKGQLTRRTPCAFRVRGGSTLKPSLDNEGPPRKPLVMPMLAALLNTGALWSPFWARLNPIWGVANDD